MKPYSVYLMESDDHWYIGSAWNKTTPQMRYVRHISGRGGATKLWEVIQSGVEFTQSVLEVGEGESVHDAYCVEEMWIHKLLSDDSRECLNVNIYPSHRRGWAESPESIARRAENNRGRPNPKNAERLLGQPRPDLVEAWARPGHKEERGKAISAGMAAMSDEDKAIMRSRQCEAQQARWANNQITHCKHGHEFTPENTAYAGIKKARRCKACVQRRQAESRRKAGIPERDDGVHCRNGHVRTEETTYVSPSGVRQCKECRAISRQKYREDRPKS